LFHCLLHHKQSKLILFHTCLLLQKNSRKILLLHNYHCPPPPVYIFVHPLLHLVALQEDRHWLILDLNYRNFLYKTNETSLLIEKYFTGRACRKSSEDAKEARKWRQNVQDIRNTAYTRLGLLYFRLSNRIGINSKNAKLPPVVQLLQISFSGSLISCLKPADCCCEGRSCRQVTTACW